MQASARRARRADAPWATIAATVGLSKSALVRWRRGAGRSAGTLRRVRVVSAPAPRAGLAIVTAAGHRVEGLSLDEALALVRALG
jgi:hypothetical protein